jgi:hypothetical protein
LDPLRLHTTSWYDSRLPFPFILQNAGFRL